ncbi:MAG: FtsK/SpoIIIE domain-containing protein [Hominilimicola sp.]
MQKSPSILYYNMEQQPHLLIAGCTGSGKSVLLNGLVCDLIKKPPTLVQLILIDPKRVELSCYAKTPHCLAYACDPDAMTNTLEYAVELMMNRYDQMQRTQRRRFCGSDVYVIVDEFADLITTDKKRTLPLLMRLAQLGRAAKVHLFIATQRPTRDIVSGQIKVNMDSRVALRCPSAIDSRNIINVKGAETLPKYGKGYYLTPDTIAPLLIDIPNCTDDDIDTAVAAAMEFAPPKPQPTKAVKAKRPLRPVKGKTRALIYILSALPLIALSSKLGSETMPVFVIATVCIVIAEAILFSVINGLSR